jgi:hypothetical protein
MNEDNYEDIINIKHFEPKNHIRMSKYNRAAQFAPFSALMGYEEEIIEMGRITDKKIEIDDGLKNVLNNKLKIINEHINEEPKITITYFINDLKKEGGEYNVITDNIKKIDSVNEIIVMKNNKKIPMNDILSINCDILKK